MCADPFQPLRLTERNALRLRSSGLRVLMTGGSGWLGRATLEMLESAFPGPEFAQRVVAFGSRARPLTLRSGRQVHLLEQAELPQMRSAPTLLLHYAFATKDKTVEMTPAEYQQRIASIRAVVSQALSRVGVTHLLLPSSGAVYGLPTRPDRTLCTDAVLNPYGAEKIEDETHFLRLSRELGIRVAVARVFNLAGPYINKHGAYALSSIINAVLAGDCVRLRAAKRVIRDYVSVEDFVNVSLGWLLRGSEAEATIFDTGRGEAVELSELARRSFQALGHAEPCIERPALGAEPDDRYLGDPRVFATLAAELGVTLSDLDQQIRATAAYLAAPERPPDTRLPPDS